MRCLIETHVLLRALDRNHPQSRLARRAIIALRRQGAEFFVAARNLIEFWAVATRPVDARGLGMTVQWTVDQLARMRRFFTVLAGTAVVFSEWERLVINHQV